MNAQFRQQVTVLGMTKGREQHYYNYCESFGNKVLDDEKNVSVTSQMKFLRLRVTITENNNENEIF